MNAMNTMDDDPSKETIEHACAGSVILFHVCFIFNIITL